MNPRRDAAEDTEATKSRADPRRAMQSARAREDLKDCGGRRERGVQCEDTLLCSARSLRSRRRGGDGVVVVGERGLTEKSSSSSIAVGWE